MEENKKGKIIIIGPAYPYRGGPSTFVTYLYKKLSVKFNVKIYNYKLLYPNFLFPGTTQYDKSKETKLKAPNERLINSINPLNWFFVAAKLKKENADLIVFDWWHPFFAPCHFTITKLIKSEYKNKILFITENFISHEENKLDNILTKLGLKNADMFLALSDVVANDLKQISGKREIYKSELPAFDLYADKEKFTRNELRKEFNYKENDKVLLFFGYVRKYKGLDILLKSFPKILNEFENAKLLIVGEFYDDVNKYSNLIKELNIIDKVQLVNEFVPNEDVGKYYTVCDLVMLPYKSATQSAVLNVAYSFNKPVVVTSVGGLEEFVNNKETGIVVKPNSPDEIYKGVKEFFQLKDRVDFDENIEKFKSQNKFEKIAELFEEIINN